MNVHTVSVRKDPKGTISVPIHRLTRLEPAPRWLKELWSYERSFSLEGDSDEEL